jgi:hypothetical protein
MMCPTIYNLGSCEIRAVIRVLCAENMNAAEIRKLCAAVYGQKATSEETLRQ